MWRSWVKLKHHRSCNRIWVRSYHAAPKLDLCYDESTVSLILFEDCCYGYAFSGSKVLKSPSWWINIFLDRAHRKRCADPLRGIYKHGSSSYWSCPYSTPDLHYDPDMPPKMDSLLPCQIESIKAIGGVTAAELGFRCGRPGMECSIDPECVDLELNHFSDPRSQVWHNRYSTGLLLLSVPTKALEYDALEWILKREEYLGLPLRFLPRRFMEGALAKGLGRSEAMVELAAATLEGVRKCVVVDLRGIGMVRKVGLFMDEDEVHRLRELDRPGAARGLPPKGICIDPTAMRQIHELPGVEDVFSGRSWWEKLGVGDQIRKEGVVCYVKDLIGTVEILLFDAHSQGYDQYPHTQIIKQE